MLLAYKTATKFSVPILPALVNPFVRGASWYMHLFRILPVLSLLFGARASYLDSRGAVPHPLDVRDAADVCGTVNAELVVHDKGVPTPVGAIGVSTFVLNFMLGMPAQ